jgi:two-component system, NtrC family, sensor kinase
MNVFKTILFLSIINFSYSGKILAQSPEVDSLLMVIESASQDSTKVSAYIDLGVELLGSDIHRSIKYLDDAILLASKSNFKKGLALALNVKGRALAQQGNFQEAILVFDLSLKQYQEIKDQTGEANILSNLGSIYFMTGNSSRALELHLQSLKIAEEIDNKLRIGTSYNNIGTVYHQNNTTESEALESYKKSLAVFQEIDYEPGIATASMNIGEVYFLGMQFDSAIYYHQMALTLCDGTIDATFPLTQLGEIFGILGDFENALAYHQRSLEISQGLGAKFELTESLIGFAHTQKKQGNLQEAIRILESAKILAEEIEAKKELEEVYEGLSGLYASTGDYKSAYENGIKSKSVKEDIAKFSTEQMIKQLQFEFELSQKEAEIELLQKDTELKNAAVSNQRIVIFAALAGLIMFAFISVFLYRNNLGKQKANRLLQAQKEEIHAQREKVEFAFDQLKSTQAQLIQAEKMASLGELTAGIAHEIQNPLNFVNNFSEVSAELVEEIREARRERREARIKNQESRNKKQALRQSSGTEITTEEQLEDEILEDIKKNLEKIQHHGKRADAIVKGMLEHSRTGSGEKEMTDINDLADEYLRLSYHGMRAKDNSFSADYKTNFDPNLPKVTVVPQDIGRVLLNIINNAFQAVDNSEFSPDSYRDQNFELKPLVIVSTKNLGDKIEISISDNGPGIPDAIKDKIFQPFFTTKPTGQGTGLGLSLSYDIVKAHGGELKVESKVGEGTTFLILLKSD